jgi:hypothetical protein
MSTMNPVVSQVADPQSVLYRTRAEIPAPPRQSLAGRMGGQLVTLVTGVRYKQSSPSWTW